MYVNMGGLEKINKIFLSEPDIASIEWSASPQQSSGILIGPMKSTLKSGGGRAVARTSPVPGLAGFRKCGQEVPGHFGS